jgi:hypothetical protein
MWRSGEMGTPKGVRKGQIMAEAKGVIDKHGTTEISIKEATFFSF